MNRSWGILPEQLEQRIIQREWENVKNLKDRLSGRSSFPITIHLKPPSGPEALADLFHFQNFMTSWKNCKYSQFVEWEQLSYRGLGAQKVPKKFILRQLSDLIDVVGVEAETVFNRWQQLMAPLLNVFGAGIHSALIKHLEILDKFSSNDRELLISLLSQLSEGMGQGLYLRALPLINVDTKFLESHEKLITDLLDAVYGNQITNMGGLTAWLGCLTNPKGWLTVRPLCPLSKHKLANLSIMQLPISQLQQEPLPASHILVIENLQSGLALPTLPDTIAVFGGGKNVAWMESHWLRQKRVAYWGDIDTWGLEILSQVRLQLPSVTALMMDKDTIMLYEERMVVESAPVLSCPKYLTKLEKELFQALKNQKFKATRLEQERLPADYIKKNLLSWLHNH